MTDLAGCDTMTPMSRHFSSGRCALIAISFGISTIAAASPPRAFGSTSYCVQHSAPPQSGEPVLRSEVDLQTVNVQVKNKQGNDVPGLAAHDFTVLENGKPQKVAFFDAGNVPATVAVLVDSSSSMASEGRLGSAAEIAAHFMRIARPGDEIWAMDFTEWTGPFAQITQEQLSNSGPLTVPGAGGVGSAVYDAIATAICHLRSSGSTRQAIIVITDGVDEHSRLSLNQLIDLVRSQRAQLFLIGLPSRPEFRFFGHIDPKVTLVTGHDIDNPEVVFDRLAKEAGAETFIPKSENGLQDALKAVSNLLESEYTLAYYLPKTSPKWRRIEVKVDRRGARVLTSRFIVANPDAAELVHYVEGTCAVSPKFHPYPYESQVKNGPSGTFYRDDFSDRSSGWPQHPDSHYVSGGYELSTVERTSADTTQQPVTLEPTLSSSSTTIVATYRDNVVAAYGPSWHDFRVSARMKAVFERSLRWATNKQFSHPVHPSAGLVFRMNEKGYYALLVSPSAEEHKKKLAFEVVAMTFQGDSFAESVIVPWTTVNRASLTETQLAVQDIADQITIFVDGQQVGAAHDHRFTDGYVGFTVAAPAHATFSNLLVEER
jgi:Ca-activated chloride channel family protein